MAVRMMIWMSASGDVAALSEGFCPADRTPLDDQAECHTCNTRWQIRRDENPYAPGVEMPPVATGIQVIPD